MKSSFHAFIAKATNAWLLLKVPVLWWLWISALALSCAPQGWRTFAMRAGLYFDAGNYNIIAIFGYPTDGMTAFYPLWPLILRLLSGGSEDQIKIGAIGVFTATFLFGLSCIYLVDWARRQQLGRYRNFVLALFLMCPLSVFRVLPFTESLFSLFLVLLIRDLSDEKAPWWRIGLWSLILSITRPMFPFLMVIGVFLGAYAFLRARDLTRQVILKRAAAMFVFAPLGYVPYGWFCYKHFGDAWTPFTVQAKWGRSFGLHWDLILHPAVINGSNEVLVWDLIGFYSPLLLLAWGMYFFWRHPKKVNIHLQVGFLTAALVGCAHSASAFLTYERFMSIGRHVLANPLPFMGLLVVVQFVSETEKSDLRLKKVFKFLLVASGVFLAMWWFRFVRDQWIG